MVSNFLADKDLPSLGSKRALLVDNFLVEPLPYNFPHVGIPSIPAARPDES